MTGIAIPETSDELEELLNDDKRIAAVFAEGKLAEFNRQYQAKALAKKAADLAPQMREQMQLGTQQVLQDWEEQGLRPRGGFGPGNPGLTSMQSRKARAVNLSRRPDAAQQADRNRLFYPGAMAAGLADEPYAASWGEFLNVCYKAEFRAKQREDTAEVERIQVFKQKLVNALSERIPAEGGFLVPENLRSEILMVALETAIVRPRARIIPMDSLRVPLPMIDDTSHASNVYGGVTAYWTEEGAALTATAPSFGRLVLEAKKLTAYTTIPNELLQDAVTNLESWFNMFFPRAIAWFEDVAFIGSATTGTGVGEPQGFLNAPAAVTVSGTDAGQVKFLDIASMYSRMWPASLNSAVWLCAPDVLLQLMQMAVTPVPTHSVTQVGGIAPPGWLTQMQAIDYPGGGTGDGVNYRLMGRPLIVTEKAPSVGGSAKGALSFVDLDYYLLGDRQTMQIASSEEYLFANDLVAYRVIERLDGRFWLQSAITPENGSTNTLSPLVIMDTTV